MHIPEVILSELAAWLTTPLNHLLQRQGHAWMIAGAKGMGQFDVSMALAASWVCEQHSEQAAVYHKNCGACTACKFVAARSHPDLLVLVPESLAWLEGWPLDEKTWGELTEKKRKPSLQIKTEAVQALIEFVQRTSARGRGLVVVIYPAEMMNHVAANALLKSLEEPAGNTRFILATEDQAALLPTIRSRCQSYVLKTPESSLATLWLEAQGVLSQEADIWLRAAGGQPKMALALRQAFVQPSVWLGLPQMIAKASSPADLPPALVETPATFLAVLQKICLDATRTKVDQSTRFFDAIATHASMDQLTQWWKSLLQSVRRAQHPLNAHLMLEVLLAEAQQVMNVRLTP